MYLNLFKLVQIFVLNNTHLRPVLFMKTRVCITLNVVLKTRDSTSHIPNVSAFFAIIESL